MAEGTATSDSHELREHLRNLRGRLDELRGRL
jgi:type VI protein secretion system component VasK